MQSRFGAVVGASLLLLGCRGGRANGPISPPDCRINLDDTSLGPGDVFDVRVYDESQLSGTYRVSAEGSINFPLIGVVHISGQTPAAAGKTIEGKLGQGFLR